MRKVIHVIPFFGIGGVERAATSMKQTSSNEIAFDVFSIFPDSAATKKYKLWNPFYYFKSIISLYRSSPDVLIVSLWRAYLVGIVFKLLNPRVKLIVFLHLPIDVHKVDFILTRIAASLASNIWADSETTILNRLPNVEIGKKRVISFVTEHIPSSSIGSVQPVFVFWGRLHKQKGILRSLKLFAAIREIYKDSKYIIIGPDGGFSAQANTLVSNLNLNNSVEFLGPKNFEEIRVIANSASFYLQTSEFEGMALSVVEAMQIGLVPIVTSVGEITHYARHGVNAIIVQDDAKAIIDILTLLQNTTIYTKMRNNAMSEWLDKPLYKEDMLKACQCLFN